MLYPLTPIISGLTPIKSGLTPNKSELSYMSQSIFRFSNSGQPAVQATRGLFERHRGIEPLTSTLEKLRSTSELMPQAILILYGERFFVSIQKRLTFNLNFIPYFNIKFFYGTGREFENGINLRFRLNDGKFRSCIHRDIFREIHYFLVPKPDKIQWE